MTEATAIDTTRGRLRSTWKSHAVGRLKMTSAVAGNRNPG